MVVGRWGKRETTCPPISPQPSKERNMLTLVSDVLLVQSLDCARAA